MKQPIHAINQPSGMKPERIAGIGFVVLFHVFAIWAIVAGLGQTILKIIEPQPFTVTIHKPVTVPPAPPAQPPKVKLTESQVIETVRPPVFTIQDDTTPRIPERVATQQPPPERTPIADSAASAITGTHTIPPYPMIAVRLSEEGRVMLHLTVSAEGNVASASVTQSSGFTDLDQTAIAWVLAHWKYKPAIRGGTAVASATDAVVVFSLKNVR